MLYTNVNLEDDVIFYRPILQTGNPCPFNHFYGISGRKSCQIDMHLPTLF